MTLDLRHRLPRQKYGRKLQLRLRRQFQLSKKAQHASIQHLNRHSQLGLAKHQMRRLRSSNQ